MNGNGNKASIIQEIIRDLKKDLSEAEDDLGMTEKSVVTARQRIISIKLKILKLEDLLTDKELADV